MSLLTRLADKAGLIGSVVSAAACVNCFPALASLGAVIGLSALSPYEGLFVRILLPAFAAIALLANALGWLSHRQWPRAALGMLGPLLVLVAVFVMRASGHRTGWLLYPGLLLMVAVSVRDLLAPAPSASCRTASDTVDAR
ncbi:organomercurial transporter MerC [Rhodanobacter sp. KK11]|jgi:mercuric ion transport protein|uniref:organomercurial transporter MerC n=1 Tax=Rhodanobacter sp. KK11 TaxID=3083255 RepID=UPI002966AAAD|nr:organomercurial transporter MerC [Rhodanobacter sp. KK11]MDW2982450.1 organomercurial transporter MerC [Rhodanobacter sp. KK11]